MTGGPQQDPAADTAGLAGKPLRRARAWAWAIFWSMAGTSVLYNCYHAFVLARMPWYTGVPESVVPLLLAIGLLTLWLGARRRNRVAASEVQGLTRQEQAALDELK